MFDLPRFLSKGLESELGKIQAQNPKWLKKTVRDKNVCANIQEDICLNQTLEQKSLQQSGAHVLYSIYLC